MSSSTIAAISTAQGEGGIGVIRISGDDAVKIADKVFVSIKHNSLENLKGYQASFGKVVNADNNIVDEAVALIFKAPHSYTGENVVEISCHGGLYITKQVLRVILNAGAIPAQAGEFTKRAFLNGKLDLAEAESVMDIISAKSRNAARAALCVKDGALSKKINEIKESLLGVAAHFSAWADYPEEDIPDLGEDELCQKFDENIDKLQALLKTYDMGQIVKEGIDTVIAGSPNVGKSTLMNLLSGTEKSIVTDIPGTTRDIVEDTVTVGDVILRLSDTAGIRETENTVEKIGVNRAKSRLENCGLVLAVFDSSRELTEDDKMLVNSLEHTPCIAVINKTDLVKKINIKYIEERIQRIVYISASDGKGIETLSEEISKLAGTDNFNPSEGILANERQRNAVNMALKSLIEAKEALNCGLTLDAVTVTLEEAISSLLELTGESLNEEVVDRVFHNFCVGK